MGGAGDVWPAGGSVGGPHRSKGAAERVTPHEHCLGDGNRQNLVHLGGLENVRDAAPVLRRLASEDLQAAAFWFEQAGEGIEQCRFAGPVGPDDRGEFAGGDGEIGTINGDAAVVGEYQVAAFGG